MLNTNEQDLQNINQIDLECSIPDDDDFVIKDLDTDAFIGNDDRDIKSKTGIIINLSDDNETVSTTVKDVEARKIDDHTINLDIDLETDYPDDTEDDFDQKQLVDETMIYSRKSSQAKIPALKSNYWDDIAKKHKASNKKGSYNTSFHFAANPEEDAKFFNHVMGSDLTVNTGEASIESSADVSSSCCEAINDVEINTVSEKPFSDQFNKFLAILGFEALKNSNDSFTVLDLTNADNDFECANLSDMLTNLEPYIYDCIIIPLQIKTNQSFNKCKEWDNWYKTLDQKDITKYTDCQDELQFCDLISNHLNECIL